MLVMSDIRRSNEERHLQRNPDDTQGKISGGRGDLTGDEMDEIDQWQELVEESQGRSDEHVIDEVGNAQDALLGGSGSLDQVHRPLTEHDHHKGELGDEDLEL
jgi:hypothetical protein